jgi:cation transport protein ChaC
MNPDDDEGKAASHALTRELLQSGGMLEWIRRTNPDLRLLTDEERSASLRAMLDARPERGGGVLVFAYGSLIWNPCIHIKGVQLARAVDWHRSFCLGVKSGRGTPENPGVMLGLRPGGECWGTVLHVAEEAVETELDLLWRREMVADGYIPRWVEVRDVADEKLGHAIAFTINPKGPAYVGDLPEEEVVRRLATARGRLGTGAEYLFHTRDSLRALGITDPFLERVAEQVTLALKPAG